MKAKLVACVAVLALLGGFAASASAAALRVVVVQTDNAEAYVKEIERGKAILKRLGSPATIRVWRARFAGADAGAIVVGIEFPDMETLAKEDARSMGDAEYAAWIKGLDKLRKIVSDSVYQELK